MFDLDSMQHPLVLKQQDIEDWVKQFDCAQEQSKLAGAFGGWEELFREIHKHQRIDFSEFTQSTALSHSFLIIFPLQYIDV